MPTLYLKNASNNNTISVTDGMILGRGDECTVKISDERVSSRHLKILLGDNQSYLMDLNSTNKTKINGVEVPPMKKIPFNVFDKVQIGDQTFYLVESEEEAVIMEPAPAPKKQEGGAKKAQMLELDDSLSGNIQSLILDSVAQKTAPNQDLSNGSPADIMKELQAHSEFLFKAKEEERRIERQIREFEVHLKGYNELEAEKAKAKEGLQITSPQQFESLAKELETITKRKAFLDVQVKAYLRLKELTEKSMTLKDKVRDYKALDLEKVLAQLKGDIQSSESYCVELETMHEKITSEIKFKQNQEKALERQKLEDEKRKIEERLQALQKGPKGSEEE